MSEEIFALTLTSSGQPRVLGGINGILVKSLRVVAEDWVHRDIVEVASAATTTPGCADPPTGTTDPSAGTCQEEVTTAFDFDASTMADGSVRYSFYTRRDNVTWLWYCPNIVREWTFEPGAVQD